MSWPSNPVNAQRATINGIVYEYDSTVGVWKRKGQIAEAVVATDFTTGNLDVTGREIVANITVTDSVNSSLLPGSDVTYDLGSPSKRWRDIYLSGQTIDLGGTTISSDGTGNVSIGTFTIDTASGSVDGTTITGEVNFANVANHVAGANVSGEVSLSTYATTANSVAGANVSGAVSYATTANSVSGSNVAGAVSLATYATIANSVSGSNITGGVSLATYATTANNVSGANVTGEVNFAAVANSVAGSNVTGQVANALIADTVATNAQPNITSVGTLSTLSVTANISTGNLITSGQVVASGNVVGSTIKGVDGSLTGNLTVIGNLTVSGTTTTVDTTNISYTDAILELHNPINSVPLTSDDGKDIGIRIHYFKTADKSAFFGVANDTLAFEYYKDGTETGGVFSGTYGNIKASSFISNVATGTQPFFVNSTTEVANLKAETATVATSAGTATTAGSVTTNSQPNITSVGTLTTLSVSGNIASGNANLGNLLIANYHSGSGNMLSNIQGANVSGAVGLATYATTANSVAGSNVSGAVSLATYATTANSVAGANVSGTVSLSTYATTANSVAGANVSGQVANSLVTGTVYTNEQPNITSVGALSSLNLSGLLTLQQAQEAIQVKTGATGAVTHDYSTGSTFYHSGVTGDFSAVVTNLTATASRISVLSLIIAQGATPYICNAITINGGGALTINWAGGTIPAGGANKIEAMVFTIINVAGTYSVIGHLSSYG